MDNRSAIIDNKVDLDNGIIPILGEVDDEMYTHLLTSIMALQSQKKKVKQLTFILNTYGGDVYQAMAIYDLIKAQQLKTTVICNGPVMSAGNIILQAADNRIMTKRSYLMFHFGGQNADTAQCLAHFAEVTEDIKDLYKSNSKLSSKVVNTWFTKDTYYNANDALKYGLIDGIEQYEPKKEKKNAKRIRL